MAYVVVGVAAFQMINGMQQAEIVREQGKIARDIANMNAEFAEVDAWNAEKDGQENVAAYEGQVEQVLSAQRTEYAAKDVDVTYGTAAEVVADTKLAAILNVVDIKNDAHTKALGYKREARNLILQGATGMAQSNLNASAIQSSAVMNAGATAASGYSKNAAAKKT